MVFNLSEQNSIANQFIAELRDKTVQQDRMRFRRNLERLGEIMAYEVSKKLPYFTTSVETPLGNSRLNVLKQQPVLITILRAGLPYFQGFINFFDQSESGFIGAYREEGVEAPTVKLEYAALPTVTDREVIVIDPMLASGQSLMDAVEQILKVGVPRHLHLVSVMAAPEGIKFLTQQIRVPYTFWTCAIDEKLNQKFYIVPGLGDAGDLSFGVKV